MRNPTLVLGSHLMRTIDATHAKYNCGNSKATRVIQHVLVCRFFGAAIGAVKIEGPLFADSCSQGSVQRTVTRALSLQGQICQAAVDLISRGEDECWRRSVFTKGL